MQRELIYHLQVFNDYNGGLRIVVWAIGSSVRMLFSVILDDVRSSNLQRWYLNVVGALNIAPHTRRQTLAECAIDHFAQIHIKCIA